MTGGVKKRRSQELMPRIPTLERRRVTSVTGEGPRETADLSLSFGTVPVVDLEGQAILCSAFGGISGQSSAQGRTCSKAWDA